MADKQDLSNVDIDALMEGTIDDIADLPEFKAFPAGTHLAAFNWEYKTINKHPTWIMKLKAIETKELPADSKDQPCVAGDETGVNFMMDNEVGQGKWKEIMKVLAAKFGAKKNRELIEESQGCEALFVTKVRTKKDGDTIVATYTDIVEMAIV